MPALRLACVVAALIASAALTEAQGLPVIRTPSTSGARWQRITYPAVPVPGTPDQRLNVLVSSGLNPTDSRLRLDVLWSSRPGAPLPQSLADAAAIGVRLHTSGVTTAAEPRAPNWIGVGNAGSSTNSLLFTFPWSRNAMDEGWLELVVADRTFWIELPYGFTRDPSAPEVFDAGHGEPAFPPEMRVLTDRDVLVPWTAVEYDLGPIQNNWRLSLKMSNPFDAAAQAVLYRDPSSPGKWALDTPRTAIEILPATGGVIKGRGTAIRLNDDDIHRTDEFSLVSRTPGGRDWGTVSIHVDDRAYSVRVPSSLFRYVHGVTNPGNARRMATPRP